MTMRHSAGAAAGSASLRLGLKRMAEDAPQPLARWLARVPFALRLGPEYGRMRRLARDLLAAAPAERKAWALPRLQELVREAYEGNRLYRTLYQRNGYHPDRLRSFEHFRDVPVVRKRDMAELALEERARPQRGMLKLNTGGTSGEPLTFCVDRHAFAREWAHMHLIWGRAGYHWRDLKLTVRGRNLGAAAIRYNPVHNEYVVNPYRPKAEVARALDALGDLEAVRWVHGYPSAVADLVEWLGDNAPAVARRLGRGLRGVLLASEFPAPQYRQPIEEWLGVRATAWYGHSEMCVLAYEESENLYVPLPSYGLAEAVAGEDGAERLVGTAYWNRVCPFIRYDTGDGIAAETEDGLLRRMSMREGRLGEFVLDRSGNRIALTALIFGRHHRAFADVRHVQVRQPRQGMVEILVVPRRAGIAAEALRAGFDFSDVALEARFELLAEPIRTAAGKVPLLV